MEPTETKPNDETQERRVRRRGYLGLAAGLVVGGAAGTVYHLLAPPKVVERTTTKTATQTETVTGTKTVTTAQTVTATPKGIRARLIDTYLSQETIPAIIPEKTTHAVRITVLHCADVKDVVPEEMIEDLEFNFPIGPCPIFAEGMKFIIEPGEPPKRSRWFNPSAGGCGLVWEALYPYILHLGSGGDFLEYQNKKGVVVGVCPSGANPASFLLERI